MYLNGGCLFFNLLFIHLTLKLHILQYGTRYTKVHSHPVSYSYSLMASKAEPDSGDSGLRALFRGDLAESRRLFAVARKREAEKCGSDPVLWGLGLALCPVLESIISGSSVSVRAIEAWRRVLRAMLLTKDQVAVHRQCP